MKLATWKGTNITVSKGNASRWNTTRNSSLVERTENLDNSGLQQTSWIIIIITNMHFSHFYPWLVYISPKARRRRNQIGGRGSNIKYNITKWNDHMSSTKDNYHDICLWTGVKCYACNIYFIPPDLTIYFSLGTFKREELKVLLFLPIQVFYDLSSEVKFATFFINMKRKL